MGSLLRPGRSWTFRSGRASVSACPGLILEAECEPGPAAEHLGIFSDPGVLNTGVKR